MFLKENCPVCVDYHCLVPPPVRLYRNGVLATSDCLYFAMNIREKQDSLSRALLPITSLAWALLEVFFLDSFVGASFCALSNLHRHHLSPESVWYPLEAHQILGFLPPSPSHAGSRVPQG